jgi:glycosyltransferase involved in cell wall biosynthesis
MRVAHFSRFTPRRSGLYEATRDQIVAERAAGLDSIFIDYEVRDPAALAKAESGVTLTDEELAFEPWDAAKDADVWVLHRGIPADLMPFFKQKRTVAVLHGTTEYLLMEDVQTDGETAGFNMHINFARDYDATVCLNEHDARIMSHYDPKGTVTLVHDAIDVSRFSPEGARIEYAGKPAVLTCDTIRINKTPANLFWAMPMVRLRYPKARMEMGSLELVSVVTWRNLICRSSDAYMRASAESIQLMSPDLRPAMRGADLLWNCNMTGIPSRTVMEAMACGTPVLSSWGKFSKYHPHPFGLEEIAGGVCSLWEDIEKDQAAWREASRAYAVENFNMATAVEKGYIPIYEGKPGRYAPMGWTDPV